MVVALLLVAVLGLMVAFQLALALGAPWGRLAWGGQHAGVLPLGYRIGSLLAALLHAGIALVVLDLAGVVDLLPDAASRTIAWVAFGLFALSLLPNAISRSRQERAVMTPVALVLAVLGLLAALQGPVPHSFSGMVLDAGDGQAPRFCTMILESYPPQCPAGSPRVADWQWAGTPETSQGMRWGVYRFEGVRDGGTITRTGSVEPLGAGAAD